MAAYTSREVTQFSITVPKHKLDEGVHVLCDMIMNPSLEPAAIEAERETISQEARHVERSYPEERIFDLLHSVAFERQPLGNDILGEGANYRNITRDDMAKFRATHYVAPKIVLSSAGAVDHAKMVELASKHFSSLPSQPAVAPAPLAPAVWHGGEIRVHNDDLEHITAAIAFQGPGVAHTDSIAMMAIQALFTSYKANQVGAKDVANKMAQAARREGVAAHINCHSVDTFYVPYTDVSMIGFHFKADPHAVDELTYSLLTELVTTCFIVSDTDLARAKATLKYNFASASDGAIRAADDVGKQLLYFGRRITPEEFAAKVDALTADDIKTVAGKYIYDRDPAVVVMGPQLEQFPDYNWVRSWTYWLTQ
jgi:predicted Zn-dependent peptidase